jgi:hypothetical protein
MAVPASVLEDVEKTIQKIEKEHDVRCIPSL